MEFTLVSKGDMNDSFWRKDKNDTTMLKFRYISGTKRVIFEVVTRELIDTLDMVCV